MIQRGPDMQERLRPPRLRHLLALLALLAPIAGCDSATSPTAPGGTILSLTVNPTAIGLEDTSAITATAVRPDGGPVRAGTEISFVTTLGRVGPATRSRYRQHLVVPPRGERGGVARLQPRHDELLRHH